VAAHRYAQSEGFNAKAAEHKGRSGGRGWKQHERRDSKKKSGWHNEQSRVLHGLPFQQSMDVGPPSGHKSHGRARAARCSVSESCRLQSLFEL
jgi:hypothetical protein